MNSRQRSRRTRMPWGKIVAGALVMVLIVSVVAYFEIKGLPVVEKPGGKEPPRASQIHESKEFNYRFVFPDSAWKQDNPTRMNVKANLLAMKRSNPNAWFGLGGRGLKKRTP